MTRISVCILYLNNCLIEGTVCYLKEWHLVKNRKRSMKKFINAIAEACYVDVSSLEGLSMQELTDQYILPKMVCPCYNRGYGAPRFLRFMAKWGTFIYTKDKSVGGLLMEIGMQRLSRGAILHEGVNLVKRLPDEYKNYTFAYDEYRIMSKECYEFLEHNLEIMFSELEPQYRDHCHKIVFGIMEHIKPDGSTDLIWSDEVAGHTVKELRELVKPYACTRCSEKERWDYVGRVATNSAYDWVKNEAPYGNMPVQRLAEQMAPKWESVTNFYRDNFRVINWKEVKKRLDLDSYQYYTGFYRKVLKAVGLYNYMTFNAIKCEMIA